jgi:twitching motility protein PilT
MDLPQFFKQTIEKNASDLHLVEGSVPALRINGELIKIGQNKIPHGELRYALFSMLDKNTVDRFNRKLDLDLSMEFFGNRFRVNLHYQEGHIGLTARLVALQIPRPEEIDISETIYRLTHLKDGLILVTGPSGAGKSTTLACMIDIINTERHAHIITIEDPIEYSFIEKQSIIEQRQLGRDTTSFSSALKYALRQDPNVIMVGEMRDLDTISAAITAAQTGHLVLSTLHTATAAETIERIVDYYPIQHHGQIAHELSTVLRGVIAQQLLPTKDGRLVAAREVLINNTAISNLIKNNQIEQIISVMQTNQKDGVVTMNKSVDDLLKEGIITVDTAKNRMRNMETKAVYY